MLHTTSEQSVASSEDFDRRIVELQNALRDLFVRARKRKTFESLDSGHMAVLHVLSERQPIRSSDLAALAGLDASTISRHIKQLIDRGLIDLTPDPDDARARLLHLSAEGTATVARIREAKLAATRKALANWHPTDIDTLTALLTKLAASLEAEDS